MYRQNTAPPSSLPPPLGLSPIHILPHPSTLTIKQKALGSTAYKIVDQSGIEVLQCQDPTYGLGVGLGTKKVFVDNAGNPLWKLKVDEKLSLRKFFYGEMGDGRRGFEVRDKKGLKALFKEPTMIVTFVNAADGAQIELVLKEDGVSWGGRMIAKTEEKFGIGSLLGGTKSYKVEVEPGVDLALIATLVIAMCEKMTELEIADALTSA